MKSYDIQSLIRNNLMLFDRTFQGYQINIICSRYKSQNDTSLKFFSQKKKKNELINISIVFLFLNSESDKCK